LKVKINDDLKEKSGLLLETKRMKLMPLDDSRWATYSGGYRSPYNLVPLIHRLRNEGASRGFWEVVWNELHHQGDVGEAHTPGLFVPN